MHLLLNHFDLAGYFYYHITTQGKYGKITMNVKDIRRENLRSLARSIGGITAIAKKLNKSQSQISHLIGTRPIKNIGDRLASEIEIAFGKNHGWLDKEHFRVSGDSGMYVISNDAPRLLNWTPVLEWNDLLNGLIAEGAVNRSAEFVPINYEVSPDTFALKIEDDTMDAPIGVSFPKGTIIIVDPSHIPTHSSFVIASLGTDQAKPIFKQLIYEGHRKFLKPLNPRYEGKEFPENGKILGVVRSLIYKVE